MKKLLLLLLCSPALLKASYRSDDDLLPTIPPEWQQRVEAVIKNIPSDDFVAYETSDLYRQKQEGLRVFWTCEVFDAIGKGSDLEKLRLTMEKLAAKNNNDH